MTTEPNQCPITWCDESGIHPIHRCLLRVVALGGIDVRAVGVSVAGVDAATRHVELTLSTAWSDTMVDLTMNEGRRLGGALVDAARRFG
ncbi:MAG TPA: hypothetical protein VIP77_00830 [Jiangellaceae bacterium]